MTTGAAANRPLSGAPRTGIEELSRTLTACACRFAVGLALSTPGPWVILDASLSFDLGHPRLEDSTRPDEPFLGGPLEQLLMAFDIRRLESGGSGDFAVHGVELWSRARDELISGELGYSIGSTYTSLSGFCQRDDPKWTHFGTLQQYWLAELLRDRGYAFWNMGHPSQAYKRAFGARILSRSEFLERWLAERDSAPSGALTGARQAVLVP